MTQDLKAAIERADNGFENISEDDAETLETLITHATRQAEQTPTEEALRSVIRLNKLRQAEMVEMLKEVRDGLNAASENLERYKKAYGTDLYTEITGTKTRDALSALNAIIEGE